MENKINLTLKNTKTYFDLRGEYTIFAQFKKVESFNVNIKTLKEDRKQLIKKLRDLNIIVSRKDNDFIFKNYTETYKYLLIEYETLQKEAENIFLNIYKNGLFAPTIDNKQLKKGEETLFKMEKYHYRNNPISMFIEIKNNLEDLKNSDLNNLINRLS